MPMNARELFLSPGRGIVGMRPNRVNACLRIQRRQSRANRSCTGKYSAKAVSDEVYGAPVSVDTVPVRLQEVGAYLPRGMCGHMIRVRFDAVAFRGLESVCPELPLSI